MKLTRYEKREMVRTAAEILDCESGGKAQPIGQVCVQSSKGGGRTFLEWAIDLRSCGEGVFRIYLTPDEGPLSHAERWELRRFWSAAKGKEGLISTGLSIMAQMGYESLNTP